MCSIWSMPNSKLQSLILGNDYKQFPFLLRKRKEHTELQSSSPGVFRMLRYHVRSTGSYVLLWDGSYSRVTDKGTSGMMSVGPWDPHKENMRVFCVLTDDKHLIGKI